jgi:DinB superfamily/Mycothiol maleylpyruvate isomerase N-terminal domain
MSPVGTRTGVDLRRAPLTALREVDLRGPDRDLWSDETALWDRLAASWAGLDDAAWHLAGAAPSDAGGRDWSLAEHVGHIAAWQELAIDYTATAIATGRWPNDDEFDGGDFDRFNERLREPWASQSRDATLERLATARERLLRAAVSLSPAAIRGDAAWGWVYMTLHGHYLDHLAIIEPWAASLRARQADGDPFVADPRATDHAAFAMQDAAAAADLDTLLRDVPIDRWTVGEVTPGWTVRDHVAHLADWAEEGVRAIEVYRRDGAWLADPDEGIDAWNERMVDGARDESPESTLARYERGRRSLREAVDTIDIEALRSPDGWSWAYDCLHGHVRKHAAMLGPWCAAAGWPDPRG